LVVTGRDFNDDRFFFKAPECVKDSVRNNHDIRFILFTLYLFYLLFFALMHIFQHLEGGGASRDLQVFEHLRLFSMKIPD